MALRTTPTIAICLTAGIAAGIALARPGDSAAPVAASPTVAAEPTTDQPVSDPYGGLTGAAEVPTETAPAAITIEGFAFAGADTVAAGAAIDVTNLDGAAHTLTADDGSFDTGDLGGNELGAITAPTTPGTYSYFCAIHPSMTGSITVT